MQAPQSRRSNRWVGVSAWAPGGQDQQQRRRARQETSPPSSAESVSAKGEKIKEDLDGLIEQIDEVLEENAEEFVRNYIQRGGQ